MSIRFNKEAIVKELKKYTEVVFIYKGRLITVSESSENGFDYTIYENTLGLLENEDGIVEDPDDFEINEHFKEIDGGVIDELSFSDFIDMVVQEVDNIIKNKKD